MTKTPKPRNVLSAEEIAEKVKLWREQMLDDTNQYAGKNLTDLQVIAPLINSILSDINYILDTLEQLARAVSGNVRRKNEAKI